MQETFFHHGATLLLQECPHCTKLRLEFGGEILAVELRLHRLRRFYFSTSRHQA